MKFGKDFLRKLHQIPRGKTYHVSTLVTLFDLEEKFVCLVLNPEYKCPTHHKVRGWGNPGGHVEEMETPFETGGRETYEETGNNQIMICPDPVSAKPTTESHFKVVLKAKLRCKLQNAKSTPIKDDVEKAKWFPVDLVLRSTELDGEIIYPSHKRDIFLALQKQF